MNKDLIAALAKEAYEADAGPVDERGATVRRALLITLQPVFEKFAELIVRKCADAADMAYDARTKYPGDYVAESMGFGSDDGVTTWRANSGSK